ncbi:MAG: DNA replication and repair protein RecF, partial [Gemmatimonadetes bacterium]
MRLSVLRLRHFRNLAPQELTLPAEGVAIVSPNARGKSNLVEAIYYLETFRSFRGARDAQLVGFQADAFHVRGVVRDESDTELEIGAAYERSSRRKRVTLDGVPAGRLGDALGRVAAVVFSPSDVGLVSDGPHARRRFLDIVLSLNAPGYLDALQRYRHALAQRNAALKSAGAQQPVDVWDAGLVEAGSRVMDARRAWVER